ncbi:MAG TPA: hypothetical protein VGL38_14420 [bacterium]|jgi:hypothetical protein
MSKHSSLLLVIIGVALLALPHLAGATATTHIWAPSTDVQSFNLWHITSDMYLPVETDPSGHAVPTVTNVGLTVGVLPFQKFNLELGIDHKSGLGAADRYPVYVNAKAGIPEGAFGKLFPALAVGMFDHGHKNKVTNYDVAYAKAAKTIGPVGRVSVGYFSGNKDLLKNANGEKDNSGLLLAWERTMPELSDKLWLCVEYMGSNSAYGTFNVGASWKFADNVALLAGYDIYSESKLNLPNTFTLQADIDLNLCGKK